MRAVGIVGVGMLKFDRYAEKSVAELAGEAALLALKDAGLSMRNVHLLVAGNVLLSHSLLGQLVQEQLGMVGTPVINVSNLCATGSTVFWQAHLAVASGMYDVVLAVAAEQLGKMGPVATFFDDEAVAKKGPEYAVTGVSGSLQTPVLMGLAGLVYMRRYGLTFEQLAKIAARNHRHSTLNPYCQYQKALSLEEIMNARMVAYPNTLYMCAPTGDGAAAVVLAPWSQARRYASRPVKVAAAALSSSAWAPERDGWLLDAEGQTRAAAQEAYRRAGLGPEDLDLMEIHDAFTSLEPWIYQGVGLCAEGEAGDLIESGRTDLGGDRPVNVSGGLVSKGHPFAVTGLANVVELAWQLRGEAGARQIEGAKAVLGHVFAPGFACGVHILQR